MSFEISIPYYDLKSFKIYYVNIESTSSPPNDVSPFVDFTSNTFSFNSKIEISNVPPPKSYTAITLLLFLFKP